ncbi:MAG: hemerythrin domain-containing protein [Actinomycetota bacterium]|nr:hemerythrin domain-containing protein [Actinomycetota bacterium]
MTERDEPVDLPAYGGTPDRGVASSADPASGATGDVVEVLTAERSKLERLFAEMLDLLDRSEVDTARLRWGGIVRESLEYEAAKRRVVYPEVQRRPGGEDVAKEQQRQDELMRRLQDFDALNPDIDADAVRSIIDLARRHQAGEAEVLLPRLAELPVDERATLGEDLRQVMG